MCLNWCLRGIININASIALNWGNTFKYYRRLGTCQKTFSNLPAISNRKYALDIDLQMKRRRCFSRHFFTSRVNSAVFSNCDEDFSYTLYSKFLRVSNNPVCPCRISVLQVWVNKASSFFMPIYFSLWLFPLRGLVIPSLHCLQLFQPSQEGVRKAQSFQQPYSIAGFQSQNCWRAVGSEGPSPAERVSRRFGLGDACCPRGDEEG